MSTVEACEQTILAVADRFRRLLSEGAESQDSRRQRLRTLQQFARELDVQYLLGHSSSAMVRRYSATYDAEKAARAHERFSPADRMGERLR